MAGHVFEIEVKFEMYNVGASDMSKASCRI